MLQAAIAAGHAEEPQDWSRLAALYGELAFSPARRSWSSTEPPRWRKRARPRPRSRSSDGLDLDRYHYLHATRAELLRRLDRIEDARFAYDRALELVHSDAERRFLEQRLAELDAAT